MDSSRAFWSACRSGDLRGMKQALACLSAGAGPPFSLTTPDVKDRGRAALHKASLSKSAAVVLFLCERGSNPNQLDNDGNTPLHLACLYGRGETVETLLSFGADASLRNGKSQTATDIATYKSNASIKALLMSSLDGRGSNKPLEGSMKSKRWDNMGDVEQGGGVSARASCMCCCEN